jgi:hypothetical protein
MADFYRFGRRMPVPSTLQIKHELRVLLARERAGKVHETSEETAGSKAAPLADSSQAPAA